MKLTAEREKLLVPLQAVIGVVERRQTMPVLANVLLGAGQDRLSITATDLEVELVATTDVGVQQGGDITVPGRKFLDILRALPEKTGITITLEGDKLVIRAGRSRFSLSTLPATEFPVIEDINSQQSVQITRKDLLRLLEKTTSPRTSCARRSRASRSRRRSHLRRPIRQRETARYARSCPRSTAPRASYGNCSRLRNSTQALRANRRRRRPSAKSSTRSSRPQTRPPLAGSSSIRRFAMSARPPIGRSSRQPCATSTRTPCSIAQQPAR